MVILGAVSFLSRPNLRVTDTTDYKALQAQSAKKQQAYSDYLASLGTTPQAQQAIFSQVLPPDQIQASVESALDAGQAINVPIIPDSQIKISSASGKTALQNYLTSAAPLFDRLQTLTDSSVDDIYNPSGDRNKIESLNTGVISTISQYEKIPVPREAVDFHKQIIASLAAYSDLLKSSQTYTANSASSPWPEMYKNYAIMSRASATAGDEFKNLNQKYNLLGDSGNQSQEALGNWLVPAARAQLATIDVWQKVQQALEEVAATSLARFMLAFMDQLTVKLEQTYRISNFLYYSDALVSGQYVDDYLNKYVSDAADRAMIKNFIPEVSCGNTQDYSKAFQAKAGQYLGFDPNVLDPNDPNYYAKLARVGNFLSSSQGWEFYYQGVAAQAQSSARQAANSELMSPGQKAGRDASGSIITPVEVSVSALRAIFQRYLEEGNATRGFSATEKITSQITQTFLNNFVFQGVVLKEQKACIGVPMEQLITKVPLSSAP